MVEGHCLRLGASAPAISSLSALNSPSSHLQAAGIVSKAFEHPFDLVKVSSVGC